MTLRDTCLHLSNGHHTWSWSKCSSSRCARCRLLAARTSTSLRFMRPVSRPNSSSSAGPEGPASADSASAAAVSAAAPAAATPFQHCQLPTSKDCWNMAILRTSFSRHSEHREPAQVPHHCLGVRPQYECAREKTRAQACGQRAKGLRCAPKTRPCHC